MSKNKNPFRIAKSFLWKGYGERYGASNSICYAISFTLRRQNPRWRSYPENCRTARQMVMARLNGLTVEQWLLQRDTPWVLLTDENLQCFRHRWLDHLADEWDKGVRQ